MKRFLTMVLMLCLCVDCAPAAPRISSPILRSQKTVR